ncbi:MAG: transcription-repair coupling factor [Flavobacteriia bacterium]|nr:transcription-repair coupling factor [Flavobacteriia bacterium]
MDVHSLLNTFSKLPSVLETIDLLKEKNNKIHLKGLAFSARSIVSGLIAQQVRKYHVFVLQDKESAAYFFNDLQQLFPAEKNILFYPASYKIPYQTNSDENNHLLIRTEVLEKINTTQHLLLITYPQALSEKVPERIKWNNNSLKIEKGKEYNLDFLNEFLFEFHFERVDFVYEPGQFAIRGGIVDVFSFSNDFPYRLEFFGNEIESIRSFDPKDQLSIKNHDFITLIPNIKSEFLQEDYISFMDFLGENVVYYFGSQHTILAEISKDFEKAEQKYIQLNDLKGQSKPEQLFIKPDVWLNSCNETCIVEWGPDYFYKKDKEFQFLFQEQPSFKKNFDFLIEDIKSKINENFRFYFFSNQGLQIERLHDIFSDLNLSFDWVSFPIALHEGFISPELKIICYTDHQIFERYHRFQLKDNVTQSKQALTLKEIYQLQKGDYVTHIDHGIGQFSGLQTIDVNGKEQEAIRLIYKDGDVLYVSIHSLHRIAKFTGKDGAVPKMNKLGSPTWNILKNKTKAKIKEIAFDLIQLYAKRKSQAGFAFSPDSYLQNELEASFIFEDTPDQIKTTEAIKKDMEAPHPMDRLICGDVGFGKTELAIRAAFKAVCDSKQVAILVPTTILCYQHFRSFSERLKDLPVNVDYINRFKSSKQITETIKKTTSGEIDILVGTHKIVSDKIKFKDLGLLIIDEEQKFGVSVKDKLKTIKSNVDTLTLTATPIPRTLQFSLMGARDLSIIQTPPPNRQAVNTEIIHFEEEVIKDAINYEISRGGQIYFIHNRLQNINEIAQWITRICPGIRIAIGHGQLDGASLEKIMMDFIKGEYDILVATTIIESGIDIPNANTIFIHHAENFGLSDLHQLRGRVGRSNKKGYCYLITPKFHEITKEARKRLEAVVLFSDLGSGFNIAMKDLDLRGSGNLLGGEQSGFISEIGFDMYQKILNEAIEELKDKEFKELFKDQNSDQFNDKFSKDCIIETDLEIRIPDSYVNQVAERLFLYQQLDNLKNSEELIEYSQQIQDRFGPLPQVVKELFKSFELRWLAENLGMEKIVLKSNILICYFISDPQSSFYDSEIFTRILETIKTSKEYKLSQKNDKLRLIIQPIFNINEAFKKLNGFVE